MSFIVFLHIFLGFALVVADQKPNRTCSDLVKHLGSLTTEIHEPIGTWTVYKTNYVDFSCKTFTYISSQVNGSRISRTIYQNEESELDRVEFLVAIVPADSNQYVAIRKSDGSVTLYYRLQPDVSTKNRHYWCGFSCDKEGIYIGNFVCFIDNDEIVPTLDKVIDDAHLPFRPETKLLSLYEDCDLPRTSSEL